MRGRGGFKEHVGTPEYMAPEVINNKFADQRADIWSYGVFVAMLVTGKNLFRGGSEYLTMKRALERKFALLEGTPLVAADLINKLLVIEPHKRLGGRWPAGARSADKLGVTEAEKEEKGAAAFSAPRTYDHEAIRAHPFFEGRRARDLYKQQVPLPMLSELAMREVMMKVRAKGWKALGSPATIARWPAPFKEKIGFECLKRELLTDELRGYLGMGPAPPPIEDDLSDLTSAASDDKEEEEEESEESEDEDEPAIEELEEKKKGKKKKGAAGGEGGAEAGTLV